MDGIARWIDCGIGLDGGERPGQAAETGRSFPVALPEPAGVRIGEDYAGSDVPGDGPQDGRDRMGEERDVVRCRWWVSPDEPRRAEADDQHQ